MGLTALIDVAIGLTLLCLGASLFVTVANEHVARNRLINVRRGIRRPEPEKT